MHSMNIKLNRIIKFKSTYLLNGYVKNISLNEKHQENNNVQKIIKYKNNLYSKNYYSTKGQILYAEIRTWPQRNY
jgi:hypothetical protein